MAMMECEEAFLERMEAESRFSVGERDDPE